MWKQSWKCKANYVFQTFGFRGSSPHPPIDL
jgi:CRISPR/Cas system-associated endonuclease Cas1